MDAGSVVYVFAAFLLAAFSKGVTGLGFSTLCLPILALRLDPTVTIPLVIVPSLCSNLLIIRGAGHLRITVQRFWPLYLAALPGLAIGLWLLNDFGGDLGRKVLGIVLLAYAVWALLKRDMYLSKTMAQLLTLPTGFVTGIINGVTGSQVMPILPYLLALDLKRDVFVTAINLSFTFSSIFMLIGLSRFGLISLPLLGIAIVGTLFVALGITLGARVRKRLSSDLYKRLVLLLLMVLGISLLLKS